MKPGKAIPWIFAAVVAGALLGYARREMPEDASAFAGTTNVVFTERSLGGEPEKHISIRQPEEVQRLVGAVRLVKKGPCACAHFLSAEFQGRDQIIKVSFCTHCFDILDHAAPESYRGAKLYRMPDEFFAQFRSYVQQRTNEQWHLPPSRKP